ncbi:MAG: hypothetical protein O7H39_05130 [Gammaproteobacteria bacterium]|nr:hypothetical protein [Gammaproteobacteria bacterium]
MTRYAAFGIHFFISLVIFLALAAIVVLVWYPDFFFTTDGGWQGIRIIVAVDLILGPALTLIVFKHGKPGLKTDLVLIGLLQAGCLIAGTAVVYHERPLALVFVDGYFYSVTQGELDEVGTDLPGSSGFFDFDAWGPKWVMIDLPDDFAAQSAFRREAMQRGTALRFMTDRYVRFDPARAFEHEPPVPPELEAEPTNAVKLHAFLAMHGSIVADYRFVPYGARYSVNHLVFDRITNELIGVLDTEPI